MKQHKKKQKEKKKKKRPFMGLPYSPRRRKKYLSEKNVTRNRAAIKAKSNKNQILSTRVKKKKKKKRRKKKKKERKKNSGFLLVLFT